MIPPSLPAILIRRICTLSAATLATFTAADAAAFTAFVPAVFVTATFAVAAEAAVLMTSGGGPVAVFPEIFSCDQPVFRTRISLWISSKMRIWIRPSFKILLLWKQKK
jgi:hypothetical protein